MNKLAQNPPQSLFSHPGTVVPAHGTSSQPSSLVQQSQGQQLHHQPSANMQNFYTNRQNIPRQMQSITRPGSVGVMGQTPPGARQFSNQLTNVMYPPFGASLPGGQATAVFMTPQPLPMGYRQQYTPAHQFPVPATQPRYVPSNPSAYNYPQAPPQQPQQSLFYPPMAIQPSPMPQMAPANVNTGAKKKSIIKIEDPVTGKDVTNEVLSSSSSMKEQHPQQSEIVAQFAAQVAAVATLTNKQASKSIAPQMHSNDEQPMNSPELLSQSATLMSSPSVLEPSISVNEVHTPPPPPPDVSLVASTIKDATNDLIENEPPYFKENLDDITSLEPAHGLIPQVPTESDISAEKQEFENRKDYESPGANFKTASQYSSETIPITCVDNQNIVEEPSVLQPVENVEIDSPTLTVELPSKQDSFIPDVEQTVVTETLPELDSAHTKNGDAPNQAVSTVPPIMHEEKIVDTKESKKTKARKKKEWNKKGESKEGGDMDAFLDKNEEIQAPSSPSLPTVTNSVPVSESIPMFDSTPSQNGKVDDTKDILEIDDKEVKSEDLPDAMDEDISKPTEAAATNLPKVPQITLKYNYKEDQWSPLNPEGKKQYDREFLIQLQSQPMSLRKPTNLPNLEVIKDSAIQHRLSDINKMPPPAVQHNNRDLFMFDFNRSGGPRSYNTGIGRRQSQQGRDKPKKVITISTSLNHDVKLHESENAWRPSHKTGVIDIDIDSPKTQELYKKVRGILNKLTPQKFQTLVLQVKQLEIETEERLNGVIDLVFEKAIDEPSFSVPYANMCKQLALLKVPVTGQENQCVNFRKLLLTKCQREFEKDYNDEMKREERYKEIEAAETEEKKKQLREELEDEERRTRRRSLGNIRFIGELFKLNMLIEPIMHDCVKKLLMQRDEDSLECLCRLLTTIGKELETAEMSKNNNKKPFMDSYFNDMQKIVDKRQTSPRVRFMLQDVIELKHHSWIPRRNESNPKTIDQIHKEAEQEAREQQQLLQQVALHKRPDDRDRKKNRNNPPFSQTDGWNIARTKGNYNMDPSKFKLTKPTEAENIQLQPEVRSFINWGRGSSGGAKAQAQEPEVKLTMLNKFSALEQVSSTHDMKWSSQRSIPSSQESNRGQSNQSLPLRLRKTPSQVKEREQLIETVKDLTRPVQPESKPRETSSAEPKDEPYGRETGISPKVAELSEEEIEKKTKPLIDEFLHNSDFKEAVQCVKELTAPSTIHFFVSSSISQVLERSSQSRRLLAQLLCDLLKKKVLTLEQYVKGLQAVLALADDFALDIPMIWNYFGEIIEPMIEDDGISISFLKDVAQQLIASHTAGKLVSEVLHAVAKNRGTIKVGDMWRESGLSWSDFLDPSEDVESFIATHRLEFTVSPTGMQPAIQLSPDDIKKQLDFLLQKKNADNEEIFDWIEANVGENRVKEPQFIRALVIAVVENAIQGDGASCVLDQKKVKQRATLLQRYLDHKEHLELQALYALQSLMDVQNHPKGVLRHVFDILYDEDLISEDAFKQWENSDDPAEQAGKGVALLSVGPFFTWLREADEESTDEN